MYAKLSRGNETRGHANPQLLKPDKSEREAIARIVALPNDDLGQAERQLLWRFRYSLVSEGNAIVKFVLIVDWNGDVDEARLGEELLSKWAPIGADSALKLLSARPLGQSSGTMLLRPWRRLRAPLERDFSGAVSASSQP